MHNEGKKHKRTVALKELTRGHLSHHPADSAHEGTPPGAAAAPKGPALQHHQNGVDQAEHETDEALFCAVCQTAVPSSDHMQYHLRYAHNPTLCHLSSCWRLLASCWHTSLPVNSVTGTC